ncbi:PA14 domain-containing protein [Methylotuvimicrobium sp. KM1]|uniref:PA14 domain-containing protein n=1 Tax=Methylotuvimicrobium sp. KM1 TaxID=3377707 RepID=UPI00385099C9
MNKVFSINDSEIDFVKSFASKLWMLAILILFMMPLSSASACDAPVGRFCVDFYNGKNFNTKPLVTRKAPFIKYNWKNRSPARRIPHNNFSARWRGQFDFKDGPHEFRATADDGVRIFIDGKLILDHWQDAAGTEYRTVVNQIAGRHLIEVEYFEATGNASLLVNWRQTTIPSTISTIAPAIATKSVPTVVANAAETPEISTPTRTAATSTPNVAKNMSSTVKSPLPNEKLTQTKKTNKAPLGINLSGFNYWSSTVPFKDLLMQSGHIGVFKPSSNERCLVQPTFNLEGYPSEIPNGCVFRIWSVFHIIEDEFWPAGTPPYQPGHYVLLYQGRGTIKLGWDAKNVVYKNDGRIEFDVIKPHNGIEVEVTAMQWNDLIRDMHIVHIDDEATFKDQPFNEKWLALLKPFQVLRFMDWGKVSINQSLYYSPAIAHTSNTITLPDSAPADDEAFAGAVALINVDSNWPRVFIDRYDGSTRTLYLKTPIETSKTGRQPIVNLFDFLNRTWAERALPNTLTQASDKGVAFETMIKLANTLDADPWITIPTAADDNFVEQLALLIKTSLKPTLKCYIEYSNETWNFAFPGYNYSEAKARQLGLVGTWVPADAWHAYRAVEIFKIFNQVFGEQDLRENRKQSRLVRVLTSQTAWLDRAKMVMDWKMPNNGWPTKGNPAYKFADAWSMTPYFSVDTKTHPLESFSLNESFDIQVDNINAFFGDSKNPGVVRNILKESKARGLQLVGYEAGTHLLAPQNNAELVAKVAQINKDPRMKDVYAVLLNHWNKIFQEYGVSSVGVMNQYTDISRYGKFGYWGLLQSTYQDPATAPKYKAINDYVTAP